MTRRRILVLVFGALTVVFVVASILTLILVRDRLLDAVDDDLRTSIDATAAAIEELGIEVADGFNIEASERALIVIDGRDELLFVPAGARVDPMPRPDLSASTIVARVGDHFQVGSVDGDVDYRVLTTELADGRHLAVAQPLDNLHGVLEALGRSLLVTLLAVIATLGAVFWWLLRASFRPYDDMIATAHAIAGGDLDRRAAPASRVPEIRQLAESLNTMLDRIQESFAAKETAEGRLRQFVSDASHELRTPLTSISGYSELYLSGAATDHDAVTKQMTRINNEAGRLTRLVNDLLTLARLDEHRQPEHELVDLAALARDAVADHRAAAPGTPLELDTCRDGHAIVRGDRDALRQVLTNLLANARHHTPAGTSVTLTVDTDANHVRLSVADDGPGMEPDIASHVFDRFYRADKSRARASGNSGLGLSIVAGIIAHQGGSIDVETTPGTGTTFVVRLPRAATGDTAPI